MWRPRPRKLYKSMFFLFEKHDSFIEIKSLGVASICHIPSLWPHLYTTKTLPHQVDSPIYSLKLFFLYSVEKLSDGTWLLMFGLFQSRKVVWLPSIRTVQVVLSNWKKSSQCNYHKIVFNTIINDFLIIKRNHCNSENMVVEFHDKAGEIQKTFMV